MKVVLSRVKSAMVVVDNTEIAKMQSGLMALCAYDHHDTDNDIEWMLEKIHKLRIFEDENEKLNYSAKDLKKPIFLVSQFSLYANYLKGNRPSFVESMPADQARQFYMNTVLKAKLKFDQVYSGIFAAKMQVHSINDGPLTIIMDSREKFPI